MKTLPWLAVLLFSTGASAQVTDAASERAAAAQFGEAIATAFTERDAKAAASMIDIRELALRAARVQGLSPDQQENFARGAESVGAGRVVAGFMQSLETGQGTVKFMRVTNTRPARALIRFDLGDHGFDYAEYVLETKAGRTRAVDWFQLSTGQLMSVTIGGIAQLFNTSDPGLLARVLGLDNVDRSSMERLRRIGDLQRSGKYAEALALFKELPDPISSSRIMLSIQSSYASLAGLDKEHARILAKLAEKYSDDPAASFLLLDHYFLTKDFSRMFVGLDAMEKRIGADSVTNLLRAAGYLSNGDLANSLKYAEVAIQLEPDRMAGYDTRATLLVQLARHADAVAAYRDMATRFDLHFTREIFSADPVFAQFVASKEFRAWLPR